MDWLAIKHPEYRRCLYKWQYILDHLDGRILDGAERFTPRQGTALYQSTLDEIKVTQYLIQRAQGESDEAYNERIAIAKYEPHFLRACIGMTGMLNAVDEDAVRVFNLLRDGDEVEVLGDVEDTTTPIGRFWRNCDGKGMDFEVFLHQVCTYLVGLQKQWVLVDGIKRVGSKIVGYETVHRINPTDVLDWDTEADEPWVKVRTKGAAARGGPKDEATDLYRYRVYYADRVEVYTSASKEGGEATAEDTLYYGMTFYADEERMRKALPIFRANLWPLDMHMGYLQARAATSIFNSENEKDFLLRSACFPKLMVDTEGSPETWERINKAAQSGSNVLDGKGRFDAPPMEPAKTKEEAVEKMVRRFYATFFQSYGDAARMVTATMAMQDFERGEVAFLNLLAAAMDELEQGIYFRLAQINYPDRPDLWLVPSVTRSRKFHPTDPEEVVSRRLGRYYEKTVPLTEEAEIALVREAYRHDGLPDDEAAIMEAVREARGARQRPQSQLEQLLRG